MRYAFIKDGAVIGTASVSSADATAAPVDGARAAILPDDSPVQRGWIVTQDDQGADQFTAPTEQPQPTDRRITRLAFLNRFQVAERIAIREAGQTDPVVQDFLAMVDAARYIDLSRQDTTNGLLLLQAKGKITTSRLLEILQNPIHAQERLDGAEA